MCRKQNNRQARDKGKKSELDGNGFSHVGYPTMQQCHLVFKPRWRTRLQPPALEQMTLDRLAGRPVGVLLAEQSTPNKQSSGDSCFAKMNNRISTPTAEHNNRITFNFSIQ